MSMINPHTFNAALAAVDRTMSEPVSAELAAAYERINELEAALREMIQTQFDWEERVAIAQRLV